MPLNLVRLDDGAGRSVMSEKGTLSLDQRRATLRGLLLFAIAVTTLAQEPATLRAQSATEFVPVTDAMLKNPAPEDWLMWRRTLDGWGYSPLDQVTPENVDELRLVWSRALTAGTQEGTPLAYGGVLYVPQASDVIQAIDAVTGDDLKWDYRRDLPDDVYEHVGGNARNNRNIAIYDRLIINTSDDSYVFALDAATGDTAWETQILDYKVNSATHSSGPIIANGRVISGRSCRPWGGPEACVITAHDARTGEIRWYYQHLNDHWDLDHPFERLLVDTAVTPNPYAVSWINPRLQPGEVRRVMTGIPGKTGVVYTLDRETGEFLWATPTVAQNVISDIDGATGAVTENAEVVFSALGQEVLACPTLHGGKDWEAGAYSPLTNTMYYPLRNACARMMATTAADASHHRISLAVRHQIAPGTDQLGAVYAISAETGDIKWLYEQRAATLSLVATGGGLVFGGDVNGRFRAFDQETGEVLWEISLGSPVVGYPISYAVDGRQHVAVSTGVGAGANLRLTPELRPSSGSTLFVFALPDRD